MVIHLLPKTATEKNNTQIHIASMVNFIKTEKHLTQNMLLKKGLYHHGSSVLKAKMPVLNSAFLQDGKKNKM